MCVASLESSADVVFRDPDKIVSHEVTSSLNVKGKTTQTRDAPHPRAARDRMIAPTHIHTSSSSRRRGALA